MCKDIFAYTWNICFIQQVVRQRVAHKTPLVFAGPMCLLISFAVILYTLFVITVFRYICCLNTILFYNVKKQILALSYLKEY